MSIYFIFSSISGGWRLPYIAIDFFPGSTFQKTALRFTGISPWLPQAEDSRHESITYRGILHDNISGWFKGLFFSRNYCFFFSPSILGFMDHALESMAQDETHLAGSCLSPSICRSYARQRRSRDQVPRFVAVVYQSMVLDIHVSIFEGIMANEDLCSQQNSTAMLLPRLFPYFFMWQSGHRTFTLR